MLMCVGMPRSGTTWIAKIIDSHPDILYNHEPDSVSPLSNTPLFCQSVNAEQKAEVSRLLNQLPLEHEKCVGKRPFFNKNYRHWITEQCFRLSIFATKVLKHNFLLAQRAHKKHKNTRLMFKSIESTGRVKLFLESEPELKTLLIVRCVFGQINSVIKGSSGSQFLDNDYQLSQQELTHLYNIHGDENYMTLDEVLALPVIEQLAYKWLVTNEKAIKEAEAMPERAMIISYDALCDDPLAGAKAIFSFLGMPLSEQTQAFVGESTSSHDDAFYSVNKNPKMAKSHWQKNITNEQVVAINKMIKGSRAEQFMNSSE